MGCEFIRHQSWSSFCDPHWELTCRNKWHPGISEVSAGKNTRGVLVLCFHMEVHPIFSIHATGNSCRDALPCENMTLKLLWYFYLLTERLFGHYFQVWSPKMQILVKIPNSTRWQITNIMSLWRFIKWLYPLY